MLSKYLASACLLVFQACAQSIEEKIEYKAFAEAMKKWGYAWESIKMTTDDGYILTTFHITDKIGYNIVRDDSLMPVVVMHGTHSDAVAWVDADPDWASAYPMVLHLFDDGFDVWLAANRGTKYCWEHVSLSYYQPEYWAWSWAEMGIYDDVANIKTIKEITGKPKVSYIGMSQGTVQMFYALSHLEDSFMADNLFTFAALSPCTISARELTDAEFTESIFQFNDFGIYSLGGPNWEENYNWICENFDQAVCDNVGCYNGGEPMSVQTEVHWGQNQVTNRFQEYAPNYNQGESITDLIPLSSIHKVPVSMYSGLQDGCCPHAQAEITRDTIGERVTHFVTVPWATHTWWGGPRSEPIYQILAENLRHPESKSYDASLTFATQ